MRTGTSLAAALALVAAAPRARAVETRADVETDHIDAADDGGPRAAGVLLRPYVMALGQLGAEVDVALGESAAVTLEGDWLPAPDARAYGAALGVALFPQRFSFHGVYVHPRFEWASAASTGGASAQVAGAAATVGYEWTWPVGATVRLGGGASYARAVGSDGPVAAASEGLRPRVDAAVGWVF